MATVTDTPIATSNLVSILKFPQEGKTPRESYLPFFESVCDFAASKTASNQEFGLLGAVLSIAQYEIISPGVPFLILVNPGPLDPSANAAERRQHTADVKDFETQQLGLREVKQAMLVQIHPHYVAPMCQPVVRMANRSVQWIMQHSLFEEYGRLTPLEMAEITRGLDHFYSPETQSLPEHFANHLTAHNTAVANDTPFNERDKVAKLRSSLFPCGLYHLAIDAWAREFPTIGLQTFENLRTAIQIADNNRDRLATASAFGYGVAAAVRPALTPVPTPEYALILEQLAALAARIDKSESKAQSSQPKKDAAPYCYTHGLCAHSSKECQTPGPNHNVNATAKNTMGGAAAKRRQRRN